MTKRYTRHKRQKKIRRKTIKGGTFTQQELQQLQDKELTPSHISTLQDLGVSITPIANKNETKRLAIPLERGKVSTHMDNSFESQGTMNIDELNTSNISDMSGYTTGEVESDDEFGGRRRRRTTKKTRGKKSRKTRKQRGGMCYGNGVGANSYDPNDSIYNTNMLKLFPYRPN